MQKDEASVVEQNDNATYTRAEHTAVQRAFIFMQLCGTGTTSCEKSLFAARFYVV